MRVFVNEFDVVTAYGWGTGALWSGLMSGTTAISETEQFAGRNFVSRQAAMVPGIQCDDGESRVMVMLKRILAPLAGRIDPSTPVVLATTVGEIEYVERAVLNRMPEMAQEALPQRLLARVKKVVGATGPGVVVSSACASASAAITRAAGMIRHGRASSVLVVACDAVSEFVYSGFSTLAGLSESPARPFDGQRDGLSLGEAAGWVLLAGEKQETSCKGVEIVGWGNTTDAVHMTAPDREGRGLAGAICKACRMAGRGPDEVAFIAAHGTATTFSDAMEMVAFGRMFSQNKPVFSVKGGTGHTLGAAGLVQLLVAHEALVNGMVPPTVGLRNVDEGAKGWAADHAVAIADKELALSTNSGFGGVNTAILLSGGKQP